MCSRFRSIEINKSAFAVAPVLFLGRMFPLLPMGNRDMKRFATCLALALLVSGCGEKSDSQLTTEAQESVKQKLAKEYKPGECEKWLYMESAGAIKSGSSKLACDNEFNVSKGLAFSDIKIYRHDSYSAVCGKVSGFTDRGTIDGDFVFSDKNDGSVFIKKSKYRALQQSDDKSTKNISDIIERQFVLESMECQ